MTPDNSAILEVLQTELSFIEKGGYGRSVRTPWLPTSTFEDSTTCLNFGDPNHSRPCSECLLIKFVPVEHRSAGLPCHHIPLDEFGETVHSLERWETQSELENVVKNWLRAKISRLEEEGTAPPAVKKVESICCLRDVPRVAVA